MRNRVSQSFSFPNRVWERELEHLLNVRLDKFIIIPNHLHGIVIILRAKHLNEEFLRNLKYRQKMLRPYTNAPLHTFRQSRRAGRKWTIERTSGPKEWINYQ